MCAFAYLQLRGILTQAVLINVDSLPGVYLIGRLESVALEIYSSSELLLLEHDPARIQQIENQIQQKTADAASLLRQYPSTITTAQDRELFEAINRAMTPYQRTLETILRMSADPKTKEDAQTVFHEKFEPTYRKLRETITAELEDNKTASEQSGRRIQETVANAKTGILIGLIVGIVLALTAGYVLIRAIDRAIDRPLAGLVAAMEPMRTGDFSRKSTLVLAGEFGVLASGLDTLANSLSTLIRRVQTSALQVNTSTTEIAATAQEQLSTSSEVAATTSEIGATSKEISTTSKELVETIKEIAEIAAATAGLAGSGHAGLTRMKATMRPDRGSFGRHQFASRQASARKQRTSAWSSPPSPKWPIRPISCP